MNETARDARQILRPILPEIVELRHAIHREPEIALSEHRTREKVLAALEGLGLDIWEPLLGTDMIAELPGKGNATIVLRADMDALPMEEQTGLPYASRTPGMMHACGHDGHTAALVGAARVLSAMRDRLPCTVRFVFQPGEEVVAAGGDLVERGACRGATAALALHCWPGLPVGRVAAREGAMFAASDHFTIEVTGQGGHGAMPDKARNPITAAAEIAVRMAELHRQVHDEDGSIVTVCAINAGSSSNIIPPSAQLLGTMRFLDTKRGRDLEQRVEAILADARERYGVEIRLENEHNYPLPVINTPDATALVRDVATNCLGEGAWDEVGAPTMGAEDFAFFVDGREGAMFRLGMGENSPSVHNPTFDFNDEAMETAVMMLALVALHYPKYS